MSPIGYSLHNNIFLIKDILPFAVSSNRSSCSWVDDGGNLTTPFLVGFWTLPNGFTTDFWTSPFPSSRLFDGAKSANVYYQDQIGTTLLIC